MVGRPIEREDALRLARFTEKLAARGIPFPQMPPANPDSHESIVGNHRHSVPMWCGGYSARDIARMGTHDYLPRDHHMHTETFERVYVDCANSREWFWVPVGS